jgi:hypothetical protein
VAQSSDESFVELVGRALASARLEAIVIGVAAAVLQGAPATTQDVDLLVRRTRANAVKIRKFRSLLGDYGQVAVTADVDSLVGPTGQVDLIYDAMPPGLQFESVRSRAATITVGRTTLTVASLEDVIRSKRAADRPKDRAQLPILEATLKVKAALAEAPPRRQRAKSTSRTKKR